MRPAAEPCSRERCSNPCARVREPARRRGRTPLLGLAALDTLVRANSARGFLAKRILALSSLDLALERVLFVDGSWSGRATHLGRFTVTYELEVDLLTSETFGSSVFTAANGDSLTTDITGLGTPTENPDVHSIVEVHSITGGTGRFAGATGSFIRKYLLNLVTGVTSGSFDGTIVLPEA